MFRISTGRCPWFVLMAVTVVTTALMAPARGQTPDWAFAGEFATTTTRAHQPRLRWWWPGATVTDAEIRRELAEIAAAGFGGVEIADVYDNVHAPIDPKAFGWGTPRWNAAVAVVLEAASQHGLTVDLTVGPHWPAAVPTIVPGDAAAAQELVHGQTTVDGGQVFDGSLPAPALKPSGMNQGNPAPPVSAQLLRVLAARCHGMCAAEGTVTLEAASVVDLSAQSTNGRLNWSAPAGGQWLLLPIYTRPTGQIVNMFDDSPQNSPVTNPQSYAVDSFGKAGTQALIDYWNQTLLTPQVRQGLTRAGGALFEDSLELKASQHWTPGLLDAFAQRRGYSAVPYLPVLIDRRLKTFSDPAQAAFTFDHAELGRRVRRDWNQTLAELWQEQHLEPMRDWAKSLGLIYRNQPYGGPVDAILAAATTGQPEGESLGFGKDMDKFRALRAGRDIGGGKLLSDEMGAFLGAYDTPWTRKMLPAINRNFAAGVNQLYLHGYAYADAPGATWPGFAPFGTQFAEPWNAMQPGWRHITDITGYLTRVQTVLQQGHNQTDIAVLRQQLDLDGGYLDGEPLLDRGYTLGYLSPATLDLPGATVRDGVLNPDGAAFRALVLTDATELPVATLRRIVALGREGLPVIVVGELPQRAPSLRPDPTSDAQIRQLAAELLALPRVVRTDATSKLPVVLAAAGIGPTVSYERPAKLRHIHRHADDADFHYFFNDGDTLLTQTVGLVGTGVAYELDPWTGAVRRLTQQGGRNGRVAVPLRLNPGQTVIVALRPVDGVASADSKVAAKAPLPEPVTITHWRLQVESWEPDVTANQTRKRVLPEIALNALAPWSSIAGLEDVSGIGTYRAQVNLGSQWTSDIGAVLVLGQHSDTVRVRINGKTLGPVDQLADRIDLGHALQAGDNRIEIELATTLNNVLLATNPTAFEASITGPRTRADYGLLSPVRLEPYRTISRGD